MLKIIYLLFVLPFVVTFVIGFLSYKGEKPGTSPPIIPPELLQQLQKAGYLDSNGKLKILNFMLDFMTHGTS